MMDPRTVLTEKSLQLGTRREHILLSAITDVSVRETQISIPTSHLNHQRLGCFRSKPGVVVFISFPPGS